MNLYDEQSLLDWFYMGMGKVQISFKDDDVRPELIPLVMASTFVRNSEAIFEILKNRNGSVELPLSELRRYFDQEEVRRIAEQADRAIHSGEAESVRVGCCLGVIYMALLYSHTAEDVARGIRTMVGARDGGIKSGQRRGLSKKQKENIQAGWKEILAKNPNMKCAQGARTLSHRPGIAPAKPETIRKFLAKL